MPNYKNGKIYMLEPTCEYDDGDIYYGATIQTLAQRLAGHKRRMKCKSNLLFQKYGIDNVKIILIKDYPSNSKAGLEAEEAKYIRNNACVNKNIPTGIIADDRDDWFKQYHQTDAYKQSIKKRQQTDAFKETQRKHRQTNTFKETIRQYKQTDAFKESQRKYNQSEKRKESQRKYQQTAEYKEYQRQYYQQRKKRSQSV